MTQQPPKIGMWTMLAIRVAQVGYPFICVNTPHPWPASPAIFSTTIPAANE